MEWHRGRLIDQVHLCVADLEGGRRLRRSAGSVLVTPAGQGE